MRLNQDCLQGRSHIVYLVTLGIALILCAGASASSLPSAQQIVRDMDGAKFTYVQSVNGYPGSQTTFRSASAFTPQIADVLSDTKHGFAKITLAIDYVHEGFVSHDAIFEVTYRLYDQGWRLDGEIHGASNEYHWVVLNRSASNSAMGSGPSAEWTVADIAAIKQAVAERLTMTSAIKAEIAESMYEKGQPPRSCSWKGSSARRVTCPGYMSIGESGQIRIDLESIGVPALKGTYLAVVPRVDPNRNVLFTFCSNAPPKYLPDALASAGACKPEDKGSR